MADVTENRVGITPVERLRALARAVLRPAGARHEIDADSYRLLVASLFASPLSLILGGIVGALLPYFSWMVAGQDVFLWLTIAATATLLFRVQTIVRFQRSGHAADALDVTRRWDREFFIGATCSSIILGLNCYSALTLTHSTALHVISIASVIAFASGYVARNAGRPGFVLIQLFCFCVPSAAGLFLADESYFQYIGYFMLLYIFTNISITLSLNRNLLALAAANKTTGLLAETLRHKNMSLDSALNSMTHGLAMYGPDMLLGVSNSKFDELYSLPPEVAVPGRHFDEVLRHCVVAQALAPASADDLAAACRRVAATQTAATLEIQTERQQTYVVSVEPTPDGGILVLTEDATARKAIAAKIEQMAHYDSLTGLANRFKFNEALKECCAHAIADRSQFSVLYIDLDNFKHINDSLGHDCGDRLLVETALRLRQFVSGGDLVARIGGDEFVLLHAARDDQTPLQTAQRVVDAMSTPFQIDGMTMYVTTSVGVAVAPEHGSEPADVLRASDIALYAAKSAGRNTVALFDPSMAEALYRRREIENDLREACQTGRLFLQYQPIVSLATGEVTACEALMRWKHPTKGMVPPDVFIPVAEQTGLIADMGNWAIRQACMDAMEWPAHISVSVNVSAFQFKDTKRLIDAVKDALLISRLAPSRLELEVTESLLIEDQKTTLNAIRALRRIGVRFALDDFGTGYSSLAYLARYPFSKVKIDRTFARHVTTSGPSRSIIEVVCQLAERLGLRVVVEGIETEEQKAEIQKLGAEHAQGYLFGRPELAESLMVRLRRAA
jgi:diguanylate cyclase (GGDEF)-like protein